MSDRLQRISDNAGRLYVAFRQGHGADALQMAVAFAIAIEQEVARQTLVAFGPKTTCTCEDVPGDHARCPIHGES